MTGSREVDPEERGHGSQVVGPSQEGEVLRVQLLGEFRVSVGDRTVEPGAWRLRKAKSLVKLLALAPGHRLHREQVLDLLWPDLDAMAATNNLYVALSAARRALLPSPSSACPYLRLRGDQLSLYPGGRLWVDVEVFESAAATARRTREPATYRSALDRYTGDLLPEDRYEDWAEHQRDSLRGTYLGLLDELARLHEQRGELGLAIEVLGRALIAEPMLEQTHVALMRLYALTGRRRQALRQYEQLREALERELDTEPDTASRRLYEDILARRFPPAEPSRAPHREVGDETRVRTTRPHNLPAQLTSFIGREREMAEVRRLLNTARLLTLSGAGGSGKTRLALEVASDFEGEYPDGMWLVELATLSDPALVPYAVALSLGVQEEPHRSLVATLAEHLTPKRMLLLLDNCEHLVEACAALVATLLAAAPRLQVLTTSREALRVPGEIVWKVPPLSLPDPAHLPPVEELARFESVRLFLERARYRRHTLALTSQNASPVVEICARLDGIPLAIELAAARAGVLEVEQIADRLGDSLGLLTRGARTAAPRHRTLRGTLDWSYDLLSESERALFVRLSVFAGGFTLEAAEAIGSAGVEGTRGSDHVLDLLSSLVDKSLVVADVGRAEAVRYRMLEPVRQYARERLEESGRSGAALRQHAVLFLALAERAEPELEGPRQAEWLERLETEHDNLRAALSWSLGPHEERRELGLRLAGSLWPFWEMRGRISEGYRWLNRALAGTGALPAAARAKALNGAGWLACLQGDYEQSRSLLEEALHLFQELGDTSGAAGALHNLGAVALYQGEYERAERFYQESLKLFRELGQKWRVAVCLANLGLSALYQGEYQRATPMLEESLALQRELGDRWASALPLSSLGLVALYQGDYERADGFFGETLGVLRELGATEDLPLQLINLGWSALGRGDRERAAALFEESLALIQAQGQKRDAAECLEGLAAVAGLRGEPEHAARLWGAAEALREALGTPLTPVEKTFYDRLLGPVRARPDEATREQIRGMSLERAISYAAVEIASGIGGSP